mmetsp:Transcript_27420/g.38597  ORF Transcript_27420/g.38597 Transcript_27420/m.38597 type:complete len:239 (-) Transcript_27420:281-997(-)
MPFYFPPFHQAQIEHTPHYSIFFQPWDVGCPRNLDESVTLLGMRLTLPYMLGIQVGQHPTVPTRQPHQDGSVPMLPFGLSQLLRIPQLPFDIVDSSDMQCPYYEVLFPHGNAHYHIAAVVLSKFLQRLQWLRQIHHGLNVLQPFDELLSSSFLHSRKCHHPRPQAHSFCVEIFVWLKEEVKVVLALVSCNDCQLDCYCHCWCSSYCYSCRSRQIPFVLLVNGFWWINFHLGYQHRLQN